MTVLNSWKEISSYMGRGIRTLQRWENQFGLPIRRPAANPRSAVMAMPDELDQWLRSRAILKGNKSSPKIHSLDTCSDAAVRPSVNTRALYFRPSKTIDHATRQAGLQHLASGRYESLPAMLQALTQFALQFCNAGTAGISQLRADESGALLVHWDYVSGALSQNKGFSASIDKTFCGATLVLGAPQLFDSPSEYFNFPEDCCKPVVEALVVPIAAAGQPFGTVWILSHDPALRFNLGHAEILTSLATFCAAELYREHGSKPASFRLIKNDSYQNGTKEIAA